MLEVENLTKRYGARSAVDHLSFALEKGCVCGLLGPNGAGKSTTMNMLTGYLGIDEGDVRLGGVSILEKPEQVKGRIGYLPEIPPLYPDMTVEEYLTFSSELKRIPRRERREQTARVMELAGIGEMRRRLIKNLSKGYRQRVGLASAVLGDPELIILDEPTVGLDPKQVAEVRELIRELSAGRTIIFSSHILSEVQQLCDYVVVLSRGTLVTSGKLRELEKSLGGGRALELETTCPPKRALEICRKTDGVQSAEMSGETVVITPAGGADPRRALFFAFAEAGEPIVGMKYSEATLEELFLSLTREDET